MTEQQIESKILKLTNDLAWWVTKLATSRTASNLGIRSAHVSWHKQEIAILESALSRILCSSLKTCEIA
jgi:hypothetical protein